MLYFTITERTVECNSFHEKEFFSTQQVAVGKGANILHCLLGFWIQLHAAIFSDSKKTISDYMILTH
jgi:hypothetical protein